MCARGRVVAEPRLSPDGARVAFAVTAEGRGSIVVVPAEGAAELVITSSPPSLPVAAYGGGVFDWLPGSDALVYAGGPVLGALAAAFVYHALILPPEKRLEHRR